MRPLRLKMTGFGPYRETNVIDMESLGRGGLYLITGDTGAGKTFIFDAITYALFGDMSGSGRDSKSVRSQYSPDGEKTEVELVFEYCGHKYMVTRNPEYYRAKERGEGFTKQTAGATLIKPDGSVVDGSSRVTEEIKNILGIDRGQFCSIAMIAQGEFRKVLNAGTDERQKLFRKLFNTQAYSRLADELKELNKKNQEKFNDGIRGMRMYLSSVSCSFDGNLSAALEDLRARSESDVVPPDDICEMLEAIIMSGDEKNICISSELESINARLTELNNTIALARNHKENVRNLEAARNGTAALEQGIAAAKAAFDTANEKKPIIEKLENEAALIADSMESYDELDNVSSKRTELEKERGKKEEQLSDARTRNGSIKQDLADSESLLEELGNTGEELIKTSTSIEKTRSRITVLENLVSEIEKTLKLKGAYDQQKNELEPLLYDADRLEAEHSKMVSAYMREQAGILAGSLTEGEPCPVCGSVHHPQPAELSKDAPSAEELDDKQKEAKNAREKALRKMGEAQKTKGNLDAMMTGVCALAMRETGTDDLKAADESAGDGIIALKSSLERMLEEERELKEMSSKAEDLKAAVPLLKRSLEDSGAEVREIEKEINEVNTSLAAVNARYEQIKKDLTYESKEAAESCRTAKTAEAKKLKDDIEEASQDCNKAIADKRANDAKISELDKVVSGYMPVDEEAAAEAAAAAESDKKALTEKCILIASELKSARSALDSVKTGAEELERIRREHEIIDSLFRTANGSLPGKDRITLEAYVQSFYFERIIRRANIRLRMMSDGQYEFVRAGVSGDKRQLTGLDLCVLDHYSGTERPVNTLSGGESFMASLSLALGLSDEVQASAGGIRLDTMFVDEGFGSLDSETLEKAIRTLTELSDEDKLVGIISHVEALKSRIDRQIIVTKDRNAGSKATVII